MTNKSFTLAMIQMPVAGGEKAQNLKRAAERVAQAADRGAEVALLPEAMDLGWTHPSALREAEPVPEGTPARQLSAMAARHGIHLCAGLTEKASGRVYNTAVLFGPAGELLGKHRKLNELDIGHGCYSQGDRLNVMTTGLGTFGLMTCADGFAVDHVLSRALGYMGADIILSPCAWAVPADHDNQREPYGALWRQSYQPVARAFSIWIVGVSNVGPLSAGPWAGRRCIGCSLAVNPEGAIAAQGPYGVDADAIICVEVALRKRPARGCGWEALWQADPHRRPTGTGDSPGNPGRLP